MEETTFNVNSLYVAREFRKYGLKLDTHKQWISETSLLLLKSELSETILKNSLLDMETSFKGIDSYVSDFEIS